MKRKPPNLRQLLAAAYAQLFDIPREHVKAMTTKQLLSLGVADHDPVPVAIAVGLGWTPKQYNHPSNLTIRLVPDHDTKTATRDVPQIAKTKRVSESEVAFRAKLAAKQALEHADIVAVSRTTRPFPSRKFYRPEGVKTQWPKGRKIQSRKQQ